MAVTQKRRTHAQRREEAERLILDAAIGIVAARGLDELTLADAGEAAGYSRGLPSHYFGSKAELYAAIAEHIREWFFTGLRSRANRQPGLANLLSGIDFYFDACTRDRQMVQALHMVLAGALYMPTLAAAIAKLSRDSVAAIEEDIRAGIAAGDIRRGIDAKASAAMVLASVRGSIAQWLVDPRHVDLAALRAALVSSLKRAFAP